MDGLLQRLEEEKIDTELVIKKRFMGREEMYLRFLKRFPEDKNFELLKEKLQEEDIQGAFRAVHTLKGVVESLGLSPMFPAVFIILQQLRQGITDNIEELMEQAQEEYDKMTGILEELA